MRSPSNITELISTVISQTIDRNGPEMSVNPLLVGVSGGPDSCALLAGLVGLTKDSGLKLHVVHYSHGFRPRAERKEAAMVQDLAAGFGLECSLGSAPIDSKRHGKKFAESSARTARFTFFAEAAETLGASTVALGHTMDDQAETVLLRLTRGAGLHGIGAMRELTPIVIPIPLRTDLTLQLFRPLLAITREQTEAVCIEAGISPVRDRSNTSLLFSRNRIRLRVLKELQIINPAVKSALARHAKFSQMDEDLLRTMASLAVRDHESFDNNAVKWPRELIVSLPRPLLMRIFQMAWEKVYSAGSVLSASHLNAMIELLSKPRGKVIELPYGYIFSTEQGLLRLGIGE